MENCVLNLRMFRLLPRGILKEGNTEPIDIVRHAVDFEMFSYEKCGGITYIDTEWEWTDKNN